MKIQNIKSKDMYICHDFTRNQKMFNLTKKYKTIIKKKFKNIKFIDYRTKSTKIKICQIYWGDLISQDRIHQLTNLKWIHLASSGIDKLNNTKLDGIKVSNSRGVMSEAVSNTIFSYIFHFTRGIHHLGLLRNKKKLNRINLDKSFDDFKILSDCNFLVLGNGNISKKFGKLIKNFSKTVTIISQRKILDIRNKNNIRLNKYDFIINLLPKNNLLTDYFDFSFFSSMNKNSYFINVGRGDTVNESDLYFVLKKKIIKGAAIDVFKEEPLKKTNKLLELENCLVSPHTAGWFNNYWINQTDLFIQNLNSFIKNKKFKNQINNVK